MENIEEIIKYIKVSTKLGHSVKHVLTEIWEVYGSHNIFVRQFLDGKRNATLVQSLLKDATKSGGL